MAKALSPLRLYRKSFGKIERVVDISNLIEMQRESYARFLQKDASPVERSNYGLQGVFKSVFPIPDGFFLVVEQGDIDWANHDNDDRAMIGSVADLDGAVRAALAFVDRPGDRVDWTNTVLLVTADHATGGLWLAAGKTLGAGDLPYQEDRLAQPPGSDRGVAPNGTAIKSPVYLSPNVYPDEDVSYGTAGHTNELVNLGATGAAARSFLSYRGTWYPGLIIDNTQIHAALHKALRLPSR